ncbi:hypothetical protein BC936DRAFT_147225 [Jimgerdemannia flammicorona]|uniref:Uncharacterized protein n=1 Tax=Jimgerdemannia flammicorona TaxID=994334 RepID=A0A433D5U7_9FUNG|nr:hypothetical protein BC936DRAFT_147225 [Jimgerdemannia flammicorona]
MRQQLCALRNKQTPHHNTRPSIKICLNLPKKTLLRQKLFCEETPIVLWRGAAHQWSQYSYEEWVVAHKVNKPKSTVTDFRRAIRIILEDIIDLPSRVRQLCSSFVPMKLRSEFLAIKKRKHLNNTGSDVASDDRTAKRPKRDKSSNTIFARNYSRRSKWKPLRRIPQISRTDSSAVLRGSHFSGRTRNDFVESVHEMLFDMWVHDVEALRSKSEETWIIRCLSPALEKLLQPHAKVLKVNWGELGLRASSVRRNEDWNEVDRRRVGQKTDTIFNIADSDNTECGLVEVSGPLDDDNDVLHASDDKIKLAKGTFGGLEKVKVWGLQIAGK